MKTKTITINNLHEFTEQEVFDYVVEKTFQQGVPSYNAKEHRCYYRLNGLKCAAGHLIPDDFDVGLLSNSTWTTLVQDGYVPVVHSCLIQQLQIAHDSAAIRSVPFLRGIDARLAQVAEDFNLTYERKYED
jgi:hypothetical protein